jgi:menaquinol-cytochrome c reductase iron-sulfur subunit
MRMLLPSSDMANEDQGADRRQFLKVASCALGGGIGAAIAIPALRVLTATVGETTVTTPKDPIDIGSLDRLVIGSAPVKLAVVAPVVRDAWNASKQVPLGAAWLQRLAGDKLQALSAVCPHLGCAIGWNQAKGNFECPCHESYFEPNGERTIGPSSRGMDPLPITIENGRLKLRGVNYRQGVSQREPV